MFTKQRVEQLLAEGKSVTDLFNLVLEAPRVATVSPLLQRAALVRWFDRALFDEVLAADLADAPAWEQFIESAEVEPLRGDPPRYGIRDVPAHSALDSWKQRPTELQEFSGRLAGYFATRDPVEHFTHLVLADPVSAHTEFLKLYREADEAFDLARCDILLRTLQHRNGLVPSLIPQALRDALNDREQYYRSRTLFADDYWRTMAFVERPALVQHFEEWQRDADRWVLHLYGKGGFGKTMFLRWLIARRCVREIDGRRIPVARLDSDHLDLPSLSRWPWLVLMPVAQQLDVQLPGSPFGSLLRSFGDMATVLRRPTGRGQDDSRTNVLNRLKPEVKALADQIPKLFQSGLGNSRVVIVLDTVEELLLHHRSGLQAMLNHFLLLRERCSGLQVLLSGRYNLADPARLPQFMKQHCPEQDRLLIEGFETSESLHYLRDLRKVPPDRPLDAIVRKTQGNPFELALFADLAIANPGLTVRDVERYPDAQYARLIERIIDRIPTSEHGVAWLLRYAVIPRQLTFEFVRDVLGPFLPQEMSRRSQLDQPNDFGAELSLYAGREVWRKHREEDLRRIWNQLSRYASDHSWVELKGDVLTLQPEVRVPMRKLLREQKIHPLLQEAAARHFEQCAHSTDKERETSAEQVAQQDHSRWARYMPEALYHRFHLEGVKAARSWRRALNEAKAKDLTTCVRVAEVPLSSDFVAGSGRPIEYPGGPLVTYDLLAEASEAVAWLLLVERLRSRSFEALTERLTGEFRDAYRRVRFYRTRAKKQAEASPRGVVLDAAQALLSERNVSAEKLLRQVERSPMDTATRVVVEYLLARTLSEHAPEESDGWFASAARRAVRLSDPPLSREWIGFRQGRRLEDREELESAWKCFQGAWERAVARAVSPTFTPSILAGCFRVLWALGRWSEAERLLRSPEAKRLAKANPRIKSELAAARVRLALDRQNPALALKRLPTPADGTTLLLCGITYCAAMQVVAAEERLNEARDAFVREGSSTGPMDALYQKAFLFLDSLGNVHQAEETLHSIPERETGKAVERAVLQARIRTATGNHTGAAELLRSFLKRKPPSRQRLQILSCLTALGLASSAEAKRFLRELAEFAVPSRYPILEAFRFSAPLAGDSPYSAVKSHFLESVPRPERGSEDFELRAWLWGLAAPSFGCANEAQKLLLEAYRLSDDQPHLQRQFRGAMNRAGELQLPDRDAYLTRYESVYTDQHELLGTALLEEAEYALSTDPAQTAKLFARAEPFIAKHFPDHSHWAARRHELSAHVARHAQQDRAAFNALLTAHRAALNSGAIVKAGNLERELGQYRNVASQRFHDADLLPPVAILRLEPTAGGVRAQFPDGATVSIPIEVTLSGSRTYAAELVERLAYSRVEMLGKLRESLAPLAALPPDQFLEIQTGRGPLASIPWEAAFPLTVGHYMYRRPVEAVPIRDTVLLIQQAIQRSGQDIMIDGIHGPQTDALLKNFGPNPRQARRTLLDSYPPFVSPHVLVVQRSAEEEQFLKRGHGNFGVDLVAEYKRRGVEVTRLSDPQQLTTVVSRYPPSLLHLVTAFQESTRTGEVYLDFGDREASVSPSALDGLLRRISGTGLHPFVLIEAILPPDPYDQARQALMRTAFCDELFRFGNTRGVLAAGLAEPPLLAITVERMADAAARRRFAAALHRDLAALPLLLHPVLFTLDPEIPVLW